MKFNDSRLIWLSNTSAIHFGDLIVLDEAIVLPSARKKWLAPVRFEGFLEPFRDSLKIEQIVRVVSRKARELGVAFQALDLFAINLGAHGKDSAAVNKERTCAFLSTITNPSKWKNFANNVMRAHTAHQAGKGIYCLHGDKKLAVRLTMAGRTRTSFTSRPRGR